LILMAIAYGVSTFGLGALMVAPAVFAFGLVAFGFLGMGPVTIAVDSYGPVTDNAQSVFELSLIEQIPGIQEEIKRDYGFVPNFEIAKDHLEENDGAGNTFKASAKPVLIDSGGGRDDDDFLDYRGADGRTEDRAVVELVHSSPAISAWTNRGRSGDLLVHGRFDAGRDNRRVSGGGVHQGQYQTGRHDQGVGRGQQKSGRNLHKIRAKRHVKHLFDGVFRHFVVRVLRVLLLHR